MDSWTTTPGQQTAADLGIGDLIQRIIGGIIVTVVAVIGIVGNILNLIVIPRISEETLGEATRIFYSALSLADLMTASMLLGGVIFIRNNEWSSSSHAIAFCKVAGFLGTCAPPVGASFIFLLNLDRYIQVTRPYAYDNLVTRKRAIISVVFCTVWIVGVMLLFVGISEESFDIISFQEEIGLYQINFSDPHFFPYTTSCFALLWLIAILLLVMYADILRIARRHVREIAAQQNIAIMVEARIERNDAHPVGAFVNQNTQDAVHEMGAITAAPSPNIQNPNHGRCNNGRQKERAKWNGIKQHLRTLRTPLIITNCFLVAWLPFTITLTYASGLGERLNEFVFKGVYSVAGTNCVVNIFVYLITRRDFRKTFLKVVLRRQ